MTETRPWMEAIEMQFAMLRDLRGGPHDPTNLVFGCLRQASTYAWSTEPTIAVVTAAQSIPETAVVSDITLPEDAGFWWFGSCVPGCRFNAILWSRYRWKDEQRDRDVEDVCLTFFMPKSNEDHHAEVAIGPVTWPMHASLAEACRVAMTLRQTAERLDMASPATLSELFTETECRTLFQLFMAGCVFLEQRYLVTTPGHVERHRRKAFAREHDIPLPGDVKVIELRRRESTPQQSASAMVEWSCRWIVHGHWTHQPYGPGHSERRLQYILPYVKGPDDRPLKVPSHTVYAVKR